MKTLIAGPIPGNLWDKANYRKIQAIWNDRQGTLPSFYNYDLDPVLDSSKFLDIALQIDWNFDGEFSIINGESENDYTCILFISQDFALSLEYDEMYVFFNESDRPQAYAIIEKIQSLLVPFYKSEKSPVSIRLLVSSCGRLALRRVDLSSEFQEDFVDTHYNEDFQEVHKKITENIAELRKGIILLHGAPGTGKSTYIKYLCSVNDNIIYIPPDMSTSLTDPGFIPLLMENKNSILVIEDAENVLRTRSEYSSQAVSNLLNLSDGILSDCLNIRMVCTFNTELANIDPALLRAGRLIAQHEFDALSVDKSDALMYSLHKKHATRPMTLAEIYNPDVSEKSFEEYIL